MKNKLIYCKTAIVALCLIAGSSIFGQGIQTTNNGEGNYSFESEFPAQFLHFYLFGDGHHSFLKSPTHTYDLYAIPATPTVYYTKPYGPVDPEEEELDLIQEGTTSATIDAYDFDNKIQIKRSWNLVESNDNYFILMFENIEDPINPISGCVEFHFSASDMSIIENDILDDFGNDWVDTPTSLQVSDYPYLGYQYKYSWTFDDLQPNEQRFVYIPAWCQKPTLSKIKNMAVMKVDDCATTPNYDPLKDGGGEEGGDFQFYTLKSVVSNYPHDPNCIVSDTRCLDTQDISQSVEYRIYFQNEGVDAVEDVVINLRNNKIPFNNTLFSYDVILLGASHNCSLVLDPTDVSSVIFEDIHLVGTNNDPPPTDYDQTIGWVDLEFCYDLSGMTAIPLDHLEFNVDIFFDSEDPIQANHDLPRENTNCGIINIATSCAEITELENLVQIFETGLKLEGLPSSNQFHNEEVIDFQLSPVPSMDFLQIEFLSGVIDDEYEIRIFDVRQNLIRKLNYEVFSNQKVDISDLPPNVYMFMLKGPETFKVKKFIKF